MFDLFMKKSKAINDLPWPYRSRLERYVNGKLQIELGFLGWVGLPCDKPKYFRAVIKRDLTRKTFLKYDVVGTGVAQINPSDSDEVERPMLVYVDQFIEGPQSMPLVSVPSTIRLESINNPLSFVRDEFNTIVTLEAPPSLADGELGESGLATVQPVRFAVTNCQIVDNVIQPRSQIVEALPDDDGPSIWDWLQQMELDNALISTRIEITREGISLSRMPPLNRLVQKFDVFLRSI